MKLNLKNMVLASIMGAISGVLMLFKFPLPIAPTFMKMDFSDSVLIIGGFLTGPVYSLAMIFIKWIVKLIITSTSTAYAGELSGLILNISFILPMSYFYSKNKTKKTAIILMIIFSITTSLIAIFTNVYMIFPLYGLSGNAIVGPFKVLFPFVDSVWQAMLISILPFNLMKIAINSIIALVLYKKVSTFVHRR
jgi:riboflavin transporter FmnP